MPGDERKFKRRRIFALPPTCNRERDIAASHTSTFEGVSTICVAVGSLTGVPVDVGGDICVGEGSTEAVAEGSENGVEVPVPEDVSVAVLVADGLAGGVSVDRLDVSVGDGSGRSVGGALVGVSFAVGVSVGKGGGVLVEVSGPGAFTGIQKIRQINNNKRRMATTSLNRSYPGARVDASMLSP